MITEHKADWTRIPGTPSGTNIALGRRTHRQSVLELACSPVSSGDATHMDEIHRLTRVTARGLRLPRQAFNTDTDRGPKGKGRLMRVCGLRRLASPTIEGVRRAPRRGSGPGVATLGGRRATLPLSSLSTRRNSLPGLGHSCPGPPSAMRFPGGPGRMTCLSRPPRSLQGAGSDEALVRVPGITNRARDSLPMPLTPTGKPASLEAHI